ncbi:hypothetical protein LOTGIDRAFT_175846, partial [Lottia gigantea]
IIPDCKNGGTLVEENGKFKCNCPLNTFGDDCNCRFKFTNATSLFPDPYAERLVSDSAECDENCANDIRCSTSTMTYLKKCKLYETPVIFVSYDEDLCIEKCNEMSEYCRYKYSNVKSLTPRAYAERTVSDSAKCDENCANDTKCSTSTTWLGTCLRYKTPIIFVSLDGKEDQCIEKCNEMSECKTICTQNHTRNFSCYLFNVTLDKIPDNMKRPYKANYKVAEKICD